MNLVPINRILTDDSIKELTSEPAIVVDSKGIIHSGVTVQYYSPNEVDNLLGELRG